MPDVLDQIRQRQARESEQELAVAQHNLDWNSTFSRMPPDHVLRETRDMTALIASAVEKKMALAAQTSVEAQRIYINDQKFKAWQQTQPLRDKLLEAQIKDEESSVAAREAQELLTTSRRERDARTVEQTALAQWEMDELESSNVPEKEKRAWINSVRGRYPAMDKDATARHEALHLALNPEAAKTTGGREWQGSDGAVYRFIGEKTTRNGKPIDEVPEGVSFKPTKYMNVGGGTIVNPETGQEVYKAPDADKSTPSGVGTLYSKTLGELSSLYEKRKAEKDKDELAKIVAEIAGKEESIRSLEALNPKLSETRTPSQTTAPTEAIPDFQTADEVRAAFRAGKLPRAQAEAALKNKFGLR